MGHDLKDNKTGYWFCVIAVSSHGVTAIIEDARKERHLHEFKRQSFSEFDADDIGTEGLVILKQGGDLDIEIDKPGKKVRRRSTLRDVIKELRESGFFENDPAWQRLSLDTEDKESEPEPEYDERFYWISFSCMPGYEWEVDADEYELTGWYRDIKEVSPDGRRVERKGWNKRLSA